MLLVHDVMIAAAGVADITAGPALQQIGLRGFLHHMSAPDALVFLVLCAMSLLSWYCIFANALRNIGLRSRARRVVHAFWHADSAQASIRAMQAQPRGEPFSRIALDCALAAMPRPPRDGGQLATALDRTERIDRALRQAVARESRRLRGGLTVLAAIGSSAVYVGLLGTVIGIYYALINIGTLGQASITAVAGPVGEALIMTAFGLFAAIPAVLAYNYFNNTHRVTCQQFDEFARDLHDFFVARAKASDDVG